MRRLLLLTLVCVLVPVATADAKLRSPHLSSSCASGFKYGEVEQGPWRIEGCNKEVDAHDGEELRRAFQGKVEVNGLLIEGSKDLLVRTLEGDSPSATVANFPHQIKRNGDAKIVLDPLIAGQRRRIVLHSGSFLLESVTRMDRGLINKPPIEPQDGGTINLPKADVRAAGDDDDDADALGTTDIPVGGDATILGLLTRTDEIDDADVHLGTTNSSSDPGSIEFGVRMSLGPTASALLKDATARVKIKTVDGTGMQVTGLKFAVPDIVLPGIGGFRDLSIAYSEPRDEWSGGVELDLGELFPGLDFEMAVSASTGVPTSMSASVSPLNIPIGQSGIFLQGVRASFNTNPLILGAGATATAGPQVAGAALIELNGDMEIRLEPTFRLEAEGSARVLPVGSSSQLATGNMSVILDADGYLSLGGGANYQLLVLGVGIGANIQGRGAYATDRNRFNIEASATGTLYLGFLGSIDVVRYAAVVSSEGWGTCGSVNFLVKAGVGQHWDGGVKLLLGCDLTQFEAPVNGAKVYAAGANQRTFTVAPGTKKVAVRLRATGPDPTFTIRGPGGNALSSAGGTRTIGNRAAVLAPPGSNEQAFFMRNPRAGTYTVGWTTPELDADASAMVVARDTPPVKGKITVNLDRLRPGRRRLQVAGVEGLGAGESLAVGVRTPNGLLPIGEVTQNGGSLDTTFDEVKPGRRQIVGTVVRDGIPMPARTRVLGRYIATLPPPPRRIGTEIEQGELSMLAVPRKGAELPDRWLYVVRSEGYVFGVVRGKPGRPVSIKTIGANEEALTVTARPMLKGRVLRGRTKTVRVR